MQIDQNTRLNALFKFHLGALDAIVAINSNFAKLKNPFLRKIMAPRTTISMAAKIGGCSTDDFYHALQPLGFTVNEDCPQSKMDEVNETIGNKNAAPTLTFDVRPILSSGDDPLRMILEKVSSLQNGETLCIKNSFEPLPLIALLKKKGFSSHSVKKGEQEYLTYFKRVSGAVIEGHPKNSGWDDVAEKFGIDALHINVTEMQPPLPMVTILEELESLQPGKALYVHHKRVPLYLLPELKERGFECRVNEISKNEVHLLIFKL